MDGIDFEWNDGKAATNVQKHGVTFDEAQTVFDDPLSRTRFDPDHSDGEDRFITLGLSAQGRLLVVWHTDRGETIRIIGSRYATRKEHQNYGQT